MGFLFEASFRELSNIWKSSRFSISLPNALFPLTKNFFFSVLTLKPSPIILPWHPSKDTDQKAKQGNKVKKKRDKGFVWGIGWFFKALKFFFQRYFSFSFLLQSGRTAGYKPSSGCPHNYQGSSVSFWFSLVTMKAWVYMRFATCV